MYLVTGSEAPKARRRRGASAGRAEKRTCGAGLAMPAFAGVVRTIGEDQGRRRGELRGRWRIPATAAGTASGVFFELRCALAASRRNADVPSAPESPRAPSCDEAGEMVRQRHLRGSTRCGQREAPG